MSWEFYSSEFYFWICDMFWVNFLKDVRSLSGFIICMWMSIVAALFVENTVISPLSCLFSFVEDHLTVLDLFLYNQEVHYITQNWKPWLNSQHHRGSLVYWYLAILLVFLFVYQLKKKNPCLPSASTSFAIMILNSSFQLYPVLFPCLSLCSHHMGYSLCFKHTLYFPAYMM